MAEFLEGHAAVDAVYYPGLESSPFHDLAKRQMSQFGGMIVFELKGGMQAGKNLMDALDLVTSAVSLGDAETRFCRKFCRLFSSVLNPAISFRKILWAGNHK